MARRWIDDADRAPYAEDVEVIGYTPFVDDARVKQLDRAIAELDKEIRASRAPRLDAGWRKAWRAFVRRWSVERDSYASWGDRLSPLEGGRRIEAFGNNYLWWSASFEERSGQAVPPVEPAGEPWSLPAEAWWVLGAAAVAFAAVKGTK